MTHIPLDIPLDGPINPGRDIDAAEEWCRVDVVPVLSETDAASQLASARATLEAATASARAAERAFRDADAAAEGAKLALARGGTAKDYRTKRDAAEVALATLEACREAEAGAQRAYDAARDGDVVARETATKLDEWTCFERVLELAIAAARRDRFDPERPRMIAEAERALAASPFAADFDPAGARTDARGRAKVCPSLGAFWAEILHREKFQRRPAQPKER